MTTGHKNKTLATLLAAILGALGAHRFYLRGSGDRWGWLHASSLLLAGAATGIWPDAPLLFTAGPLVLSALAGMIAALVIGLTPDEQWDAAYNPQSGRQSDSGWALALLLVLTVGGGATALIAVIARAMDLMLTGGSYG